jgi:hypothetical protein
MNIKVIHRCGPPWSTLVHPGPPWSTLVLTGPHWPSLALTGPHWPLRALAGPHRLDWPKLCQCRVVAPRSYDKLKAKFQKHHQQSC